MEDLNELKDQIKTWSSELGFEGMGVSNQYRRRCQSFKEMDRKQTPWIDDLHEKTWRKAVTTRSFIARNNASDIAQDPLLFKR